MKKKLLFLSIYFFSFLTIWSFSSFFFHIPSYILPSPYQIISCFFNHYKEIFYHFTLTFFEVFLGGFLGFLLGLMMGGMLYISNILYFLIKPLLVLSQLIPSFIFAPFIIIWVGYGFIGKIILITSMSFFSVTNSFYHGLSATQQKWTDLIQFMDISPFKRFFHIQLKGALGYLAVGTRQMIIHLPATAIVAEWMGASKGIGYLLLHAYTHFEIDLMFATLCVLIFFSYSFYSLFNLYTKKFLQWEKYLLS